MKSEILELAELEMSKAFHFFENEIKKNRAGKVSPDILKDIKVNYYGTPTPLNQVGSINVIDTKTLTIQPWEKSLMEEIEKSIMVSNIGVTPQNDGEIIRIIFPPLTEERRKEIFKQIQKEAENCKIAIRNIRREKIERVKKVKNDVYSEDEVKEIEIGVQNITNKWTENIDKKIDEKRKEIMTV